MRIDIKGVEECADHRPEWEKLFTGYVNFYHREMTPAISNQVWDWLLDPGHELQGVMAFAGGQPAGLAHYRAMPRPMAGSYIGFLDDLFVDPVWRGRQVARHLLDHLAQTARSKGWESVRWLTGDDNYAARSLYDQVARKTMFNLYEMKTG